MQLFLLFFPEECAAACYCNSDCQWWSHDIEFDNCILTADCVGIDSGCDTCVSGATGCDVTGDECEAGMKAKSHSKIFKKI